ncbi:MAG: protein-S-isoprenylcysteine O-methyltransferase Ste14 [Flavobacteriaceae bacterium]|jgi:protein-S-isoprenylcysteine O-methyltransferase Ste14
MGEKLQSKSIHEIVIYSYNTHLIGFMCGISLDFIIPLRVFPSFFEYIGAVFLVIGTVLVFWAAYTTRHAFHGDTCVKKQQLKKGPYFIMQTPVHNGLVLSIVGFGFILNSLSVVIIAFIMGLLSYQIFMSIYRKKIKEIESEEDIYSHSH